MNKLLNREKDLDLNEIEAIIFDLGGVIIDVDMEAPYVKLLKMSKRKEDELLIQVKNIAYQYEIGLINDQEFINKVQNITELNLTEIEIKNLWNEMLGYVPN
ncbi:hypothetical protein [Geminocystis sp. GBBB08]|uniref:hypothetical protein n=1 Tax=Geminocystis sp. GBBB08 TaxID=2604140 RepID=UPI0027E2DC48|nr:hypothetical protein [Geminocystis sp. GBBB08]